jgi:hypothetical protein
VQAVFRQLELEETDVGSQRCGDRDRRRGVARFGDDGEVMRVERLPDAATVGQVVVRYENRQIL